MALKASENIVFTSCLSITKEGSFYRCVYCSKSREKGWIGKDKEKLEKIEKDAQERLKESSIRSMGIVRQYARCNDWEWFFTFTVDPKKWDSFVLSAFYKKFSKMINNLNYRRTDGKKLIYMIIPEQHKSGRWHLHGLLSGFPDGEIVPNKHGYLDWPRYAETFGYCSLSPIRDKEACTLYISKYVSKNALQTPLNKGEHYVLASKGLKKGNKILNVKGSEADYLVPKIKWDYVTDNNSVYIKTIKEGEENELLSVFGL